MKSRLKRVEYLLAGDIGATKSSLGLFDLKASRRNPIESGTFINQQFQSFQEILTKFTSQLDQNFSSMCLGVAGPVIDDRVSFSNINWSINQKELSDSYSLNNIWLINDLQASAEGIELLKESELKAIWKVAAPISGNKAVIAPGTGLGEGYLIFDGQEFSSHPSEGGNSDFAPRNDRQFQLYEYMKNKGHHLSVEKVCSGSAIPDLFKFLQTSEDYSAQSELIEELSRADNFPENLFQLALESPKKCGICNDSLNLFLEILGAEMSNFALKIGARGGVYLGGGITPKIPKAFERKVFLDAYFDKGRYREYLEGIPIWLILNEHSPLIGAANYGYKQLMKDRQEN